MSNKIGDAVFWVVCVMILSVTIWAGVRASQTASSEYKDASVKGYVAGLNGVPATANPYMPGDDGERETLYTEWAVGWTKGFVERQEKLEENAKGDKKDG